MTQAFEKLSTVSIKDTNGTVVTTADNPTTLHTRSDLQWNITADGVVKRCTRVGETPGETSEIEYESMPLRRLETKRERWSCEKVAYPLEKMYVSIPAHPRHIVLTHVLVGISATHFSRNGSRSYAILQQRQYQRSRRLRHTYISWLSKKKTITTSPRLQNSTLLAMYGFLAMGGWISLIESRRA